MIIFQANIKLQSFAFSVCDIIPANVKDMSTMVFVAFLVTFMEKTPTIIKF